MGRLLRSPTVMLLWFLAAAPMLGHATVITAGSATVSVGDLFSIPVSVSGVSSLTSFQFDLTFDPTTVKALAVNEGSDFVNAAAAGGGFTLFIPGVIDNTSGLISLVADLMIGVIGPGLASGGVLATIDFEALSSGALTIDLANAFLTDSDLLLTSANGDIGIQPGQLVVNAAVPEPDTVLLLGLALVALAGAPGLRRIRKLMRRTVVYHPLRRTT